jgi:hypothetical protein
MTRSNFARIGIALVLLLAAVELGLMWLTDPNMSSADKIMFFTALAGATTALSLMWNSRRP